MADHGTPQRHRRRHAVEDDTCNLLDDVDLPPHVARPPCRDRDIPRVGDTRSRAARESSVAPRVDRQPDDPVGPFRPEPDEGPLGQLAVDIGGTGQLSAREIDDQPARQDRGRLGEVRVDTLLPAIRPLGAEAEPLRRSQDPDRLEVRRLEQYLVSSPATSLSAPPMIAARATGFSPSVISRSSLVDPPQRAVERCHLLARRARADGDPAAREPRTVEGVQRAAVDVHHVVRDVDDVGDRAHARRVKAGAQPHRRRPDGDVRVDARRCSAGSASGVIDP